MIMLDNATAVVLDTADLSEAVSTDNGINYIYFGADITLTGGVSIYPGKAELVIDGTYEGVTYTFIDYNSGNTSQTLGIRGASNIALTIQNINLIGRNFYGIPFVENSVDTDNVEITYINVTYSGVQLVYNQRGLTRLIDCDVLIDGATSGYQEVGEVCKVEIGGSTSIRKTNIYHAVFWFYGAGSRLPSLTILSGADVTIITANYFMYESYSPQYVIEPDAKLTLQTANGISYDGGHTVSSFLVDERASFYYTQTTNRGPATINIEGALTVSEDADFYMQTDYTNSYPIIRFTTASARLDILNPKSFVIYNGGTATNAAAFSFLSSTPFTFTGGQLNFWRDAEEFPQAGTFEDIPPYTWRKPQWEIFSITGSATSSETTISGTTFTSEELAELPQLSNLQPRLARVFSIGNLPLFVDTVIVGMIISGVTEPYANVKAEYSSGGAGYMSSDIAGEDGSFIITPTPPVPFGDIVTVSANTPFLIVALEKLAQEEGELGIVEAPVEIRFITPPISSVPDVILPRQNPSAPVIISDTREPSTQWILWASVAGRLETPNGHYLTDSVVFEDEMGTITPLSETVPIEVYRGGPRTGTDPETRVIWENNKGILGRIRETIYAGERYSTQIIWEVTPAPEP